MNLPKHLHRQPSCPHLKENQLTIELMSTKLVANSFSFKKLDQCPPTIVHPSLSLRPRFFNRSATLALTASTSACREYGYGAGANLCWKIHMHDARHDKPAWSIGSNSSTNCWNFRTLLPLRARRNKLNAHFKTDTKNCFDRNGFTKISMLI